MPRDVMTMRLERALRSRLRAVAKRRSMTPSAAARLALEGWLEGEERGASGRPYDAMADLVGSVDGGDSGRSARGGAWSAETLRRRASGRRHR